MSQHNPWKTVSSRITYENPWITVREDQVIRPDGKPGIYGVVQTRIATGVVALTPDLQLYLVGQYRYATKHYSWEIIEGGTDGHENPLDTAKRELREEGGLQARSWLQLGDEFHLSNCHSSEIGFAYLAQDLEEVSAEPEGTEVLQIRKIPFRECMQLVHLGEIKDTVTIVALFRTERLLRQKGIL